MIELSKTTLPTARFKCGTQTYTVIVVHSRSAHLDQGRAKYIMQDLWDDDDDWSTKSVMVTQNR